MAIFPNYGQPVMPTTYPMPSYTGGNYQTAVPMPQSYTPAPMSSNVIPVDGEVGAKAYMVPSGSTGPIALWDTNDNVIYMRTFNAAGMPNPLKKLRYIEEEPAPVLPAQSGSAPQIDTSQFVTKSDLEALRQEIRQLSQRALNQNGSPAAIARTANGRQG